MCGKPNPEELDVCQFCQARLKPLIISQPPESESGEISESIPPKDIPPQKKTPEPKPSLPDWAQPDWLQSLREGGDTSELGEIGSGEEPSDWTEVEGGTEGTLPDWSEAEPGEEEQEQGPLDEEQPTEQEEAAATDWLDSLRPRSSVERERPKTEQPPEWISENEPQEEAPEWLQNIRKRKQAEEPQTPPAVPDDEAAKFLDEIRTKLPSEDRTPTEPLGPAKIQHHLDEEIEVPDWLADLAETPSEGELPELPEWLKPEETLPEEEIQAGLSASLEAEAAGKEPLDSKLIPEQEETPDWLATLEESAGLKQGETSPATEVAETGEADLKVVAPFTLDEESADMVGEDIPDWLKAVSPQEASTEPGSAAEGEEGIAPAQLPTWLEAMRPVEAVAPSAPLFDERDRIIESSGPLAGLRGILPAEPDVARGKKPPTYSVKLQVTESQQAHAVLLAEQIKSEGIAQPVPRPPAISSQLIQRVAIFLVLLATILFPMLIGDMGIPIPEVPPAVDDARNLVNAIPNGGSILLAVDFQPGFSGEMEASASSVIDHLMIKGSYLTLVSTTTSGPAQAEHLIRSINTLMGHHYQDINQYANLGYIAGGLTGLRSFAETPKLVMPFALNDDPAKKGVWVDGRLANVKTLNDFKLAVVITESPDTARAWIEQVGPILGNVPLLLVVSAQAEPMVRPYYEGSPQQVKGLIAGLSDGAAYEGTMPRPSMARRFWDAYSFGIPAAVLIILIGSLISVVAAYLSSRKQAQREAGV